MSCQTCKKQRTIPMKETIAQINENEIRFCEIWENVLLRKWDIPGNRIDECYKLIYGTNLTSRCPDCMRKTASQLNNYYKRILDRYNEYKSKKPIEPEEPIITQEPEIIFEDFPIDEHFNEPEKQPKQKTNKKTS